MNSDERTPVSIPLHSERDILLIPEPERLSLPFVDDGRLGTVASEQLAGPLAAVENSRYIVAILPQEVLLS